MFLCSILFSVQTSLRKEINLGVCENVKDERNSLQLKKFPGNSMRNKNFNLTLE